MQTHLSRLSEQKMLADVWTKFRLFQKPANFDMRLAECERLLAGVKAQVGLLEVGSVEHDVVQSQLEQCMVGKMQVGTCTLTRISPIQHCHSLIQPHQLVPPGGAAGVDEPT